MFAFVCCALATVSLAYANLQREVSLENSGYEERRALLGRSSWTEEKMPVRSTKVIFRELYSAKSEDRVKVFYSQPLEIPCLLCLRAAYLLRCDTLSRPAGRLHLDAGTKA